MATAIPGLRSEHNSDNDSYSYRAAHSDADGKAYRHAYRAAHSDANSKAYRRAYRAANGKAYRATHSDTNGKARTAFCA